MGGGFISVKSEQNQFIYGTVSLEDGAWALWQRMWEMDWLCPNRFRSKQSPTKKSHVLDNQIKLLFLQKLIPTKKTLPLLSSILKKT
jgi:hypothetical protein